MTPLASTSSDVLDYALVVFFVASGLALAYMLVRLGGTFGRLSSLIKGTERDFLPVVVKAGGTVDRVNDQLDKLDTVTDSAVSMADSADTAVRALQVDVAGKWCARIPLAEHETRPSQQPRVVDDIMPLNVSREEVGRERRVA